MTLEEHQTRAMLLGAMYMPLRGWYSFIKHEDGRFKERPLKRLDALTLEPISTEEHASRVKLSEQGKTWYPHD